jgi:hypothetical protein
MKCTMDLDTFLGSVHLPNGMKIHDYGCGITSMPVPSPDKQSWTNLRQIAIENQSGKLFPVILDDFAYNGRGPICISVSEISEGINKAIETLGAAR